MLLEGPCIFIRLEPERGSWPFLLRNDSDDRVTVCQAVRILSCEGDGLIRAQDQTESKSTSGRPSVRKYTLDPHEKMQYAWDQPALSNKQLKITVNGVDRLVNVLEIGSQIPFRFPVRAPLPRYSRLTTAQSGNASHTKVMSIDVRAEGPTQAIRFSNYAEDDSVYKIQRRSSEPLSRQQSPTGTREGAFEAVNVEVVTTFSFGVSLEGIGISLVTKKMQELIYASFRGVTAKYTDSTTNYAYDLGVKWIQVDNQLFGGLYPILLYPSVIPKDGKDLEVHPSFQASVIVLKDEGSPFHLSNRALTRRSARSDLLQVRFDPDSGDDNRGGRGLPVRPARLLQVLWRHCRRGGRLVRSLLPSLQADGAQETH